MRFGSGRAASSLHLGRCFAGERPLAALASNCEAMQVDLH